MKWKTEAKVGAFTIIGIVLFIAGILFVGRIDIWAKPQMTITGDFTQVNGLKNGNQVKFSGVAIGTVSDRSEERRVGKEWWSGGVPADYRRLGNGELWCE